MASLSTTWPCVPSGARGTLCSPAGLTCLFHLGTADYYIAKPGAAALVCCPLSLVTTASPPSPPSTRVLDIIFYFFPPSSVALVFSTAPSQSRMQQVLCIHQNDHGRSGEARGEATRRGGGCVEQMEERGERRSEEGVALLLNFNEFQGEFLLRLLFFFSCSLSIFPTWCCPSPTWLEITVIQMSFS